MMETFAKGLVAGVAVAAPVGPIGLQCIRRTIRDGRAAGFISGLGAATADAVYGFMVAAGLAATGVLISYAEPLSIVGGVLLVSLGGLSVRTFLREARAEAHSPVKASTGLAAAFAATFALTIANPMTILAFVAMIAGLSASATSSPSAPYWLVAGVFVGSALWWLMLVQAAGAAKERLTTDKLRWLDLISGALLIGWGSWILAGALS